VAHPLARSTARIVRHYLKRLFYASETAYFQIPVAYAWYTADLVFEWVEAVLNADSIAS